MTDKNLEFRPENELRCHNSSTSWRDRFSLQTALSRLRSIKLQPTLSTGFEPRPLTLFERYSLTAIKSNGHRCVPSSGIIRQQFYAILQEPVSEQHQQHLRKHFNGDINTKIFTVNEFNRLFQVTSILSKRLLIIFNLKEAYENNAIPGADVIRIAHLLWISPISIKAYLLFKLFDSADQEIISVDDIRSFYEDYLSEFKFFKDQNRCKEVVDIFLQGFFPQRDERRHQELNFDQFYQILQQNPSVLKSLYLISIPDQDKGDDEETIWYQRWWMYMKNNANRIVFLILYILSLIAIIIYVIVYRVVTIGNHSVWQIFARIGGMLINYNYALAISLMLKQFMTIIRRLYYIRLFIPVDDHIDAHRLVGTVLFLSAIIHTFGHVLHFATHLEGHSWFALMFTTSANLGWVNNSAPITGVILVVLLLVMFICSLQCIRQRSGCYQLFRYTHYLFWPIFILLIIHSQEFWKWAIGPMTLFLIEKIYLCKRHLPQYGRTRLISVRIEDEHVLSLIIERPVNFEFRVGEYVNICLPNIILNEWHPFTICTSPERRDHLRLTIMKKQNWTKKIYEHFSAQLQNELTTITTVNASDQSQSNSRNLPLPNEMTFIENPKDAVVCIEGPFSTCTSYMFDCEHVVLIGAGIGITPYISALESLIYQLRKQRCTCFQCGAVNYASSSLTNRKLKKVDFIWVNREIGNFSWFRNILEEFEAEQQSYLTATTTTTTTTDSHEQRSRYLDIHLYCTSIRSNEQAMLGNLPYDLVANMYEVIQQEDMLLQLRTPTHVGRPPWKLIFAKFKAEYPTTSVLFTGNRIMADEVKKHCDKHGFRFEHEPYF